MFLIIKKFKILKIIDERIYVYINLLYKLLIKSFLIL